MVIVLYKKTLIRKFRDYPEREYVGSPTEMQRNQETILVCDIVQSVCKHTAGNHY